PRKLDGLPILQRQSFYFAEMVVAGCELQTMLNRDGGYPNIVFGDRAAFFSKPRPYLAVGLRRDGVTRQNHNPRCKLIHSREVGGRVGRFAGAEIEFAQDHAWKIDLRLLEAFDNCGVGGEKAMTMFVSRRTLPGIAIDLFAAVL